MHRWVTFLLLFACSSGSRSGGPGNVGMGGEGPAPGAAGAGGGRPTGGAGGASSGGRAGGSAGAPSVARDGGSDVPVAMGGGGASAGGAAGAPAGSDGAVAAKAPVVVTIVVDQFAAWVADARLALLPDSGGFARLRKEGTWLKEMRYLHAATDTGSGHAALYTATPPRATGLVANELVDAGGGLVAILRDSATRLVGPDGAPDGVGASARNLLGDTLADKLRAAVPDAAIVSLSVKDRAAISGCGRKPTACLWFEVGKEAFVTSTAFADSFPDWARPVAGRDAVRARWKDPWDLLDRAWVMTNALTPDDQSGEGDYLGMGITFPHNIAGSRRPADAFRYSPLADEALLDLAARAVDGTKMGDRSSLLALSLSGNDNIGHVFGPDSWEAWDELRRVDAGLARLFAALDARLGPSGWAVLLTADHGVPPLPETASRPAARPWCVQAGGQNDRWQRPCVAGARLDINRLSTELKAASRAAIGDGNWVMGVSEPWVFFTAEARALPTARRDTLVDALTRTLMASAGIERVFDVRKFAACQPATDESFDNLVCRSHHERHGAGLYMMVKPGAIFETFYVTGKGANHGGPYLFDRTVPLMVRAPGRVAAGRVIEGPLPYTAFARTAATLLGINAPGEATDGPDLTK